jgi:hypothetical protein
MSIENQAEKEGDYDEYNNDDLKQNISFNQEMLDEEEIIVINTKENAQVIINKRTVANSIRKILNSHRFHVIIIILVAIDCLFVAGELIIDYIEMHIAKSDKNHSIFVNNLEEDKSFLLTKQSDLDLAYNNATHNSNMNHHAGHHGSRSRLARFFKILELICKYGSFSILLAFVIEICFKVVFTPKNCCKFFEIFDATVVIVSFSVNFYLLVVGVAIHALSGLMTIFR